MTFTSLAFLLFTAVCLIVYYAVPVRVRWLVLLAASMGFYAVACPQALPILLASIAFSYAMAWCISASRGERLWFRRGLLTFAIVAEVGYLVAVKQLRLGLIVPLGMSFYTLQVISYLVDLHKGKIEPEKNPLRFALFVSYFPQIIQGPIPRFEELNTQLRAEHRLDEKTFVKGFQLILWGWFLKLMVADKARIIVDFVFDNHIATGAYVLLAGSLYLIHMYADFQACMCIARGTSAMFGIELALNFNRPFLSKSVGEFWRRWHITLGRWLRNYVYIPLGGSRKGIVRKYINLLITFLISGLWHGAGVQCLLWGGMYAGYQIMGSITQPLREKAYAKLSIDTECWGVRAFRTVFTFLLVVLACIMLRADSLRTAVAMFRGLFTAFEPWSLMNGMLDSAGFDMAEWLVLGGSMLAMLASGLVKPGVSVSEKVLSWPLIARWALYLAVILAILLAGSYGSGFSAKDFVYGGF